VQKGVGTRSHPTTHSAGLTIVANVAIATGPALLGPRGFL